MQFYQARNTGSFSIILIYVCYELSNSNPSKKIFQPKSKFLYEPKRGSCVLVHHHHNHLTQLSLSPSIYSSIQFFKWIK